MKRTLIQIKIEDYPVQYRPLIRDALVYDSSCSPNAKVLFIEKDGGCYLKTSEKGSLKNEAILNRYFHQKGLGPEVLDYFSGDRDWLLTACVSGEDCTHPLYLSDPERLCDIMAEQLFNLHSLSFKDCPINHTARYLKTAEENHQKGSFDLSYSSLPFQNSEEAWEYLQKNKHLLKTDTLLHGDYCLPNIMLDQWRFSGFIDLGNGGLGDRHVDLFWGAWTLNYNLKTDRYRDRFFDAYGRDRVDPEMIKLIGAFEIFG